VSLFLLRHNCDLYPKVERVIAAEVVGSQELQLKRCDAVRSSISFPIVDEVLERAARGWDPVGDVAVVVCRGLPTGAAHGLEDAFEVHCWSAGGGVQDVRRYEQV